MDGSASIGLEQALLGHSLGFAPMASPTQVYVALCLASTAPSETVRGLEASGGGYVRTPATFALISGPSNIAANTTSVEFQQATSSWGVVGFFELWDAASGGNRLYWGQLVDPADFTTPLTITVSAGDIVRFSAGTLGVQAATGSGGTASIGAYLPLAGGTLTGPVYLAGDPTDALQAATKAYVDAHSGSGGGPGFLPLSGGTMLGPLNYTATGGTTSRSAQDRAHDWINVTDFGAVLNGTTNDTAAWAAARAAATDYGTIVVPRGRQFVNTAPTGGPATPVLWRYDGNYVGSSGTTPVVGMGTDIVESFVGSKYFARSNTATGFLAPVVRIDSTVNHTGGVAHNTVTALRINATPTSSAAEDTLGVAAVITSTKPSGGNLVAVTGYSVVSPTGRNHAAFGGNISATDNTGLKSSASGISSIGAEFDVLANDDDDAGAGSADVPANQGTRVVVDVVGAKAVAGGTDAVIGWGVRVGPTADTPGVSFRRNYAAYGPFLKSAFSTEFAVQQAGANAIWLGDGHTIALNKSGANTLGYTTTGTPRLRYMAGANEWLSISDAGTTTVGGTLTTAGTTSLGTGSANYIQITGASVNPTLAVAGTGTNGALNLSSQGHGVINFNTSAGLAFQVYDNNSATIGNRVSVTAKATGAGPAILAPSDLNAGLQINGKLLFNRSVAYSGNFTNTANQVLTGTYVYTGTSTDTGANAINSIGFDDAMSMPSATGYMFNVATRINAGSSGARTSFQASINQTATTQAAGGNPYPLWVAAQLSAQAAHSEGGVSKVGLRSGAIWGATVGAQIKAGATGFNGNTGIEYDMAVEAGADVQHNSAIVIVTTANHATRASVTDAGIVFSAASNTPLATWRGGISFCGNEYGNPFGTDSAYLYSEFQHAAATPSAFQAGWFADMQQPTFTGGLIRSRGFSVDGAGTTQIGSGVLKALPTGLSIDATGSVGTGTPTVAAGGSGWNASALMRDAYNGVYVVNTLAADAIASVAVLVQPSIQSGTPPANPVPVTAFGVTDGIGASLNLTWDQTQRTLALNPSGGPVTVRGVPIMAQQALYATYTNVGNGADITLDTLQTFTMAAGQLKNVGDRIIIRAGGAFAASTDSKTVACRIGSSGAIFSSTVATAGQTSWRMEGEVCKTGANAQTYSGYVMANNNAVTSNTATLTQTDTGTLALSITGQNTTNPAASSITCRYFTVDYVAA